MRKIKSLGIALLAMFSISAVTAASASADSLTATGYPAVLTGETDEGFKDILTLTAGSATCPEPKYNATIGASLPTSGSLSVIPTYPDVGCTAFGFPATIDTNGCTYRFRVLAGTAGDVDLECTGSNELTITASSGGVLKCTVHLKTQTDIGGQIKYTNVGGKVTVEASLNEIDYTHTQGTGLGSCPGGSGTNGTFFLKAIFIAETESGGPTSLLLSA